MTTIIVDRRNKTMYADTKVSVTKGAKDTAKIEFTYKKNKILKHPSGKMIVSLSGVVSYSYPLLKKLGFVVDSSFYYKGAFYTESVSKYFNRGGEASVYILNCYTNTLTMYSIYPSLILGRLLCKKYYDTQSNYVLSGSGNNFAYYYIKSKFDGGEYVDVDKAIHYSAIGDKHTNDVIQKETI